MVVEHSGSANSDVGLNDVMKGFVQVKRNYTWEVRKDKSLDNMSDNVIGISDSKRSYWELEDIFNVKTNVRASSMSKTVRFLIDSLLI